MLRRIIESLPAGTSRKRVGTFYSLVEIKRICREAAVEYAPRERLLSKLDKDAIVIFTDRTDALAKPTAHRLVMISMKPADPTQPRFEAMYHIPISAWEKLPDLSAFQAARALGREKEAYAPTKPTT